MVAAAPSKNSSRTPVAKKEKDKAAGRKADKAAAKKSPADALLESTPELRNTVAAIEKQYGEGSIFHGCRAALPPGQRNAGGVRRANHRFSRPAQIRG